MTSAGKTERWILVPVDDTEDCESALRWTLEHIYKPGDRFSFLHIYSGGHEGLVGSFSSSSILPEDLLVDQAKQFIQNRFLTIIEPSGAAHEICLIKGSTDCDSIGEQICIKADELDAAVVVMAAHNKGRLMKYLVGSSTKYCINHCRQTVLVAH